MHLIKPIMLYGSCAWTTATEENVKLVFKLQKRAAHVILDANISDRSKDLFRRLDWLPFKDEVNLQQCSLIFRRIRNEDDCPDYITKLLPRNSDLRSDSRASRYGRFNLVCPFYNRETEGGVLLKFVELSCGIGFLLICERRIPLARLRMLLKNIF